FHSRTLAHPKSLCTHFCTSCIFIRPRPPTATPSPYTTLFRSRLSNVTGAVVKRDPRTLKLAQQRRQQRAETLSNVARNLVRMVVWSVALVMILSEVGVEIAPVIASLGVIGLAAGIGAQTIIKDFVAGVVMLFEDIVAVGDYVDLEYAEG